MNVDRALSPTELEAYRAPYPTMKSRSGLLRLLQDFPTADRPGPWLSKFEAIADHLRSGGVAGLHVMAESGLAPPYDSMIDDVYEVPGKHFVLEDSSPIIVQLLIDWLRTSRT